MHDMTFIVFVACCVISSIASKTWRKLNNK
jgi:hypothetical protein